jgi:putative ribosome biogenesis GTPase RsgA
VDLSKEICSRLSAEFGKYYDNATLDKIDGIIQAVHFTGSDYVSLHPKDNDCNFCYIREIQASNIRMVDLGGCEKTPFISGRYRFVYYSKSPFNNFAQLQKFVSAMAGTRIEIIQVINNIESIYQQETGGRKNIRLKNIGYIAIDFSQELQVNTCEIKEC